LKDLEINKVTDVNPIYTIGHSNHTLEEFIDLLQENKITALVDVRSMPYSKVFSHFNREQLKDTLSYKNIKYLFMGQELGGRPSGAEYYNEGTVDYEKVAGSQEFRNGIDRLLKGKMDYTIALLCSEKDPLNCHRMLLVSKELVKLGVPVKHILFDGKIETNQETEERLLKATNINQTLFNSDSEENEMIEEAYKKRSSEVAYNKPANKVEKVLVKEDDNKYNKPITLYTIGFTKKTAEQFFETLRKNEVKKLIDTRLNNTSQMAGFTKKGDLKYFLRAILNIDYVHKPELAPTNDILKAYQRKEITWEEYEVKYLNLISARGVENLLSPEDIDKSCLLCSEHKPDHCHRRLLAEYLKSKWGNLIIKHL